NDHAGHRDARADGTAALRVGAARWSARSVSVTVSVSVWNEASAAGIRTGSDTDKAGASSDASGSASSTADEAARSRWRTAARVRRASRVPASAASMTTVALARRARANAVMAAV